MTGSLFIADHPCPRRRHHPGEQCCCAQRLNVRVPYGYSRAADAGSVHAARLLNLRRRLAANPSLPLPASLSVLAEDHTGDSVDVSLRPLSPSRASMPQSTKLPWSKLPGSLDRVRHRRGSALQGCRKQRQPWAKCEQHNVSFSSNLVAEVPHLVLTETKSAWQWPFEDSGHFEDLADPFTFAYQDLKCAASPGADQELSSSFRTAVQVCCWQGLHAFVCSLQAGSSARCRSPRRGKKT